MYEELFCVLLLHGRELGMSPPDESFERDGPNSDLGYNRSSLVSVTLVR
jgi:hypothetical protein